MEVGDECAEAKMSVHVTPEIVIPPEIISSDFEPPDNSDIVAATLEEQAASPVEDSRASSEGRHRRRENPC